MGQNRRSPGRAINMFDFVLKGANASQLEKDIGSDLFPANEHYFGLVNFGNTCYSNSVLQALYFCRPFREKVLEYKAKNKRTKETLLTCLADLFYSIVTQKRSSWESSQPQRKPSALARRADPMRARL